MKFCLLCRKFRFTCIWFLGKFNPQRDSHCNSEGKARCILPWKTNRIFEKLQIKPRFFGSFRRYDWYLPSTSHTFHLSPSPLRRKDPHISNEFVEFEDLFVHLVVLFCKCSWKVFIINSMKVIVPQDLLLLNFDLKPFILSSWSNGTLECISLWGLYSALS